MTNRALFDIDADGLDQGFTAANGQVLALRLRANPPIGIQRVDFQVYDPGSFDPNGSIAVNPPRSSPAAAQLTLDNGVTTGPAVQAVTPTSDVAVAMPDSGSGSWIARCVVNGGLAVAPNGALVPSRDLIHERMLIVETVGGLRQVVATETTQASDDGWAEALKRIVDGGGLPPLDAPGVGPGVGLIIGKALPAGFASPVAAVTDGTDIWFATLDVRTIPAVGGRSAFFKLAPPDAFGTAAVLGDPDDLCTALIWTDPGTGQLWAFGTTTTADLWARQVNRTAPPTLGTRYVVDTGITPPSSFQAAWDGTYLYVAADTTLYQLDPSDPSTPISTLVLAAAVQSIAAGGGFIYAGLSGGDVVRILPGPPMTVGNTYAGAVTAVQLTVGGGFLWAAEAPPGGIRKLALNPVANVASVLVGGTLYPTAIQYDATSGKVVAAGLDSSAPFLPVLWRLSTAPAIEQTLVYGEIPNGNQASGTGPVPRAVTIAGSVWFDDPVSAFLVKANFGVYPRFYRSPIAALVATLIDPPDAVQWRGSGVQYFDTTTTAVATSLPLDPVDGQEELFADVGLNATANPITITDPVGKLISGAATYSIVADGEFVRLRYAAFYDAWIVVGRP